MAFARLDGADHQHAAVRRQLAQDGVGRRRQAGARLARADVGAEVKVADVQRPALRRFPRIERFKVVGHFVGDRPRNADQAVGDAGDHRQPGLEVRFRAGREHLRAQDRQDVVDHEIDLHATVAELLQARFVQARAVGGEVEAEEQVALHGVDRRIVKLPAVDPEHGGHVAARIAIRRTAAGAVYRLHPEAGRRVFQQRLEHAAHYALDAGAHVELDHC